MLIDLLESSKAIGLCPMGIMLVQRNLQVFKCLIESDLECSLFTTYFCPQNYLPGCC